MANLFHRAFVEDFWLKLISVLLAAGLWLAVTTDPTAEVEMQVPIEFQRFPENLEIDSASFTQAQVRVRGPARLIHMLRPSDVHAEVDLSGMKPGTHTFDLSTQKVKIPQDLEVVQVVPTQFQLSFDTRMTRTVEVRPRVTGNFAGGLRVAQVTADPATIVITGPHRRVESVDAATTDLVDASGVLTRATFVTQAYVSDTLVQVARPTPVRVTVIMESAEKK